MTARRRGGSPRPCHSTVPPNAVLMLGYGGPRNLRLEEQLPLSDGNGYEGRQTPLFFLPFVFLLLGLDLSSGMRSLQQNLNKAQLRFWGTEKGAPRTGKYQRDCGEVFFKFHFIYLFGMHHGTASHHIQDGQTVIQNC